MTHKYNVGDLVKVLNLYNWHRNTHVEPEDTILEACNQICAIIRLQTPDETGNYGQPIYTVKFKPVKDCENDTYTTWAVHESDLEIVFKT